MNIHETIKKKENCSESGLGCVVRGSLNPLWFTGPGVEIKSMPIGDGGGGIEAQRLKLFDSGSIEKKTTTHL